MGNQTSSSEPSGDSKRYFEENGQTIILRGVNLADGKVPPGYPSHMLASLDEERGSTLSYAGAPLELADAPQRLRQLRYLGFNILRLPVTWEAIEHAGPGIYDETYLVYIRKLIEICVEQGFKVIVNPHQDLWSRYAGGSGAPLWTLHACGLDPSRFAETHASARYCEWPLEHQEKDPKANPPMMWTTNHNRLATATLFAVFFGGRDYAPNCRIDGINIQDYLQNHYFAAYSRLAEVLGDLPFTYDSMNEPEGGFIGRPDLNAHLVDSPKSGSTPTPIECMRLGMGMEQTVDKYRLGSTGPHKVGSLKITSSQSCWLKAEDPRWKWQRDPSWPLKTCIWALHGVWDIDTGELNRAEYFAKPPSKAKSTADTKDTDEEPSSFVADYWEPFLCKWTQTIRQNFPKKLVCLQPPVFTQPPPLREEENLIYSPHFYDGLTVMQKHWHERWNADIVGLLRGKYSNKVLGLRIGKGNAKKIISDQIGQLSRDLRIPTLIGEIGVPFNLDDSAAYDSGDYSNQVKAIHAMLSGCDDHLLSYTLWTYSVVNNHEWGDMWNGEDFSIYSAETKSFPSHSTLNGFRAAAAWCRPYVQRLTGRPVSLSFDYRTSKFTLEVTSEKEGYAVIYVPWLHYRNEDDSEDLDLTIKVSEGEFSRTGQELRWSYIKGGQLEMERTGGALSFRELGIVLS